MVRILEVNLGAADRERLTLRVRGRERPDSLDSDDHNWLQGAIDVRAGRMAGSVACSLRTEDVRDFRKGLAAMIEDPNAEADCQPMEGLFAIHVERTATALEVSGHIREEADGNHLRFRFLVEASGIPGMLKDLDEILDEYPVN